MSSIRGTQSGSCLCWNLKYFLGSLWTQSGMVHSLDGRGPSSLVFLLRHSPLLSNHHTVPHCFTWPLLQLMAVRSSCVPSNLSVVHHDGTLWERDTLREDSASPERNSLWSKFKAIPRPNRPQGPCRVTSVHPVPLGSIITQHCRHFLRQQNASQIHLVVGFVTA